MAETKKRSTSTKKSVKSKKQTSFDTQPNGNFDLSKKKEHKTYSEQDVKTFKTIRNAICNLCNDLYGCMSCTNCMVNLIDDEMNIVTHKDTNTETEEYITD